MSRDDELIHLAWQLALEVDGLADEDRDRLRPLVDRLAQIVNHLAPVVELHPFRGGDAA